MHVLVVGGKSGFCIIDRGPVIYHDDWLVIGYQIKGVVLKAVSTKPAVLLETL